MSQSKMITIQELANIFRQYKVIGINIYSDDGASGMTVHFFSKFISFYKSDGRIKSITFSNDTTAVDINGPYVKIEYVSPPTPSWAEFSVESHGLTFLVTAS